MPNKSEVTDYERMRYELRTGAASTSGLAIVLEENGVPVPHKPVEPEKIMCYIKYDENEVPVYRGRRKSW